jgi:hypothetical protein
MTNVLHGSTEQEDEVARTSSQRPTDRPAQDLAELHDEYALKVNSAIDSGRLDLVAGLSAAYQQEAGIASTPAAPAPSALITRSKDLLRRLDRYTLQAYNPAWPYGPREVGVRS